MGGQQSSRRLTVENEEPNNVIKVSEKVVERLKGSVEEDAKVSTPANPPRSFNAVQIHPQKLPIPSPNPVYGRDPIPVNPIPTTTALDIRKHYEEELQKNNEYWQNRIRAIELNHERIDAIWDIEYRKALDEAEKNPMIPSKDKETLPCGNKKSNVIDCYKKNSDKPLLCANEVQAFSECVNSVRFRKALRV